jgi:hypothetical protein
MSQPPAPVHDLSVNKVLAGAGAAVTSAVIGSFFGVAGTVVGAAVGSVASTLATELYERSLDRTRARILARLRAGSGGSSDDGGSADGHSEDGPAEDEPTPHGPPRRRRGVLGWVAATVVVFLLGMLVVTGVELLKGSTVAGQPGTSVGSVLDPAPTSTADAEPSDPVTSTKKAKRVEGTETPSKTAKPSATKSAESSKTTTPTPTPTSDAASTG